MSESSKTPAVPALAWLLSIVAVVVIWGLVGTQVEVFGVEVPGWLPAVVVYALGFFAGRLAADAPLVRRRGSVE